MPMITNEITDVVMKRVLANEDATRYQPSTILFRCGYCNRIVHVHKYMVPDACPWCGCRVHLDTGDPMMDSMFAMMNPDITLSHRLPCRTVTFAAGLPYGWNGWVIGTDGAEWYVAKGARLHRSHEEGRGKFLSLSNARWDALEWLIERYGNG